MPITFQEDSPHGGIFPCKNLVQSRTADGEHLFTLTGMVMLETNRPGNPWPLTGTGPNWRREDVTLSIRFPDNVIPEGMVLRVLQWAPFITLNSFRNDGHAVNEGWGVDEFWGPGGPPHFQTVIPRGGHFNLFTRIAIRDVDSVMLRFGYHLTLKGVFEPEPVLE